MQNWNGCSSLTQHNGSNGNSIYVTLTDTRDNNQYKVAKLKDGKCWMVENLRITGKSISSSDSDMSSGSFSIPNAENNFIGTNNNAAYYRSDTNSGYYSWYTATAGTGTSSVTSGNATSSICPKGWRLPTGNTNGEFAVLTKAYGGSGVLEPTNITTVNALMASPVPGFVNSEYYGNSTFSTRNTYGFWWSSTADNNTDAYSMDLNTSGRLYPVYNTGKFQGFAVRCIKR